MDKFNSPEYKRSRYSYIVQCTAEYFVSLLVTDAYLSRLLTNIGMSDSLVGIISSFISLAFVIQIATLFFLRINVSAKKLTVTFDTISVFLFMFMYLVPFLPIGKTGKTVLVTISILFGYICKYLILNICYKWANSYVAPGKRAFFSATKEMISLFVGMFFTIIIGYIIDQYELSNNLSGAFLFIAISIFILNICNFVSLMLIKKDVKDEKSETGEKIPISEILRNTVGNKNFKSVIVLTVMWDVARYFTIGFIGVFKYKDLMMSVLLVQIVNIAANLCRLLISGKLGAYSDKYSYAKGFKLGLTLAAIGFLINVFTTKSTWYFIIVYTIFYNCSVAGTNQNSFNIVYSYVDSKYIVHAMAIKNCIGGLFGFGASLLAGKLLTVVQANNNMVLGMHIYGQQLLSAISFVLTVLSIIYISKVIEKQQRMLQ